MDAIKLDMQLLLCAHFTWHHKYCNNCNITNCIPSYTLFKILKLCYSVASSLQLRNQGTTERLLCYHPTSYFSSCLTEKAFLSSLARNSRIIFVDKFNEVCNESLRIQAQLCDPEQTAIFTSHNWLLSLSQSLAQAEIMRCKLLNLFN